ncbi:MAG: di-trans,poly-cis-decaprenylcistransferase, partial [Clostridia bacterium]|nr:di-trans,poly-cis-decaprenylcistransferase [Clostridia bacterium]
MKNFANVPKHIGFILDGNGRWATQRKLPRVLGHRKGTVALKRVLNACIKYGIQAVSLYAFSSENWKRPEKERETLFSMIKQFVRDDMANSLAKPVKIRIMG